MTAQLPYARPKSISMFYLTCDSSNTLTPVPYVLGASNILTLDKFFSILRASCHLSMVFYIISFGSFYIVYFMLSSN